MTRGTFAFITDTNPASETAMQMIVSEEFKFGGEFFWKVETLDQFVKHCLDTAIDFEYADDDTEKDDYRSESMNDYLITGNTKDNPFVMVHVVNRNGIQDYDKNPYSTIFHYSDYVYMKNMSSHPAFFKDADKKVFCLAPAQSKILCFGHQIENEEWEQFCREMKFRFETSIRANKE